MLHEKEEAQASPTRLAPSEAPIKKQLFARRTVVLFGEIQVEVARSVCSELLALASLGAEPIRLLLHSPGGHVESADSIFDVIRFIEAPVHILGTGWVASAGALIFVSVPRERRAALPNTRFLLHQPLGGVGGPASDVEIEAHQVMRMRERLNRTFADSCDQPLEKIQKDTDRNYWLTTSEALDYGLLGSIVSSSSEWGASS